LQGFDDGLRQRRVGIHQHEIVCGLRRQLVQQPEPFCCQFYVQGAETGGIAAGSAETGDESESEWVSDGKDDRNGLGCGFGRARRRRAQGRCNDGDRQAHELGRQFRQAVIAVFRPARFDPHVLTIGITGLAQAIAKCNEALGVRLRRSGLQQPDDRQRRLLRARGERWQHGRRRRAADERDEVAPPHSITSSARDAKAGDTNKPMAFAALRFITIWYFVGAWIGRSLGFSPWRIRLA